MKQVEFKKGISIKMIKKLKKIMKSFAVLGLFVVPLALPATVSAVSTDDCLDGAGGGITDCLDAGSAETSEEAGELDEAGDRVNNIIKLVINIFSLVVGVISVIMIIIGGLKYITSGGDSGNVTGAKNTILYAIIGLVVVALAQVIVRFVLSRVSNTDI